MTFWEKISRIEDYIHKYWHYVAIPIVGGFIVIYMSKAQEDKKELEANMKITTGRVYRYSSVPRKSKLNYHYEYYLNGKKYKGSSSGYMFDEVEIGEYYRVEYSEIDPSNSRMNFKYSASFEYDSSGIIIDTIYTKR